MATVPQRVREREEGRCSEKESLVTAFQMLAPTWPTAIAQMPNKKTAARPPLAA
jgi:hypothetical protein